jgi:hypothetical protein
MDTKRARGFRKVEVEDKCYRNQGIGTGCFSSICLEVIRNGEQKTVKKFSKSLAEEVGSTTRKS